MKHLPKDPRKSYERITLHLDDVEMLCNIIIKHGYKPEVTADEWKIDDISELGALRMKMDHADALRIHAAMSDDYFPPYVTIYRESLWFQLTSNSHDSKAVALMSDLDRALSELVEKHSEAGGWQGGRAFIPVSRPIAADKPKSFLAANRGEWANHAVKTAIGAIVLAMAVAFGIGRASVSSTPTPPATSPSSP
ncbi:MAG TPA: hypothetical protein VF598_01765 [Hymenobacter sp.]|jgi:hypothetical protein